MALYLAGALLFVIGSGIALLGFKAGGRNRRFNARAIAVKAVVVGNDEHYSTSRAINRRIYFPIVCYTMPSGESLEAKAPGHDAPTPEGTRIPMLCDPRSPAEVSFTGPRGAAGMAKALGTAGVVLALLGVATVGGAILLNIR